MSEISEPLLTENKNKYVLFPIEYNDIWSMYKKHVSTYWTVEEIDAMFSGTLGMDMANPAPPQVPKE